MIQVEFDDYGGPDVLHAVTVPDPAAGPGEVLVRAEAIGITFVETQRRAGRFHPPGAPPLVFPAVLGNGVEGAIVETGDGVDLARVGERVVTATGGDGGYAELVVVDADAPVPIPDGLDRGQAVAMLADGRTALAEVRAAELEPGERVLVLAAAGGVGSLLVQLVHHGGGIVVAAAGGPDKVEVTVELGADHAVDYLEPSWVDTVRALVGEVDVVLDGVGGDVGAVAATLLASQGRRVVYGGASGAPSGDPPPPRDDIVEVAGFRSIRGPDDNRALVAQALGLAADGRLKAIVGQTFALTAAADAHRAIETRTTIGKTILIPSP